MTIQLEPLSSSTSTSCPLLTERKPSLSVWCDSTASKKLELSEACEGQRLHGIYKMQWDFSIMTQRLGPCDMYVCPGIMLYICRVSSEIEYSSR